MKKKFLLGLVAMLLPLTSWAADGLKITVSGQGDGGAILYAGDSTEENLSVTVTLDGETVEATNFMVWYTQNGANATVRNVGTYTANVMITQGANVGTQGTQNFVVTPKPLTSVTVNGNVTKQYGADADLSTVVTLDGVETITPTEEWTQEMEQANALNCLTLENIHGEETVGMPIVMLVSAKTEANSNYIYTGKSQSVDVTIMPKEVTVTLTSAEKNYDGQPVALEDLTYTVNGLVGEDDIEVEFTEKDSKTLKDAGDYVLTATSDNQNYTIVYGDGKEGIDYKINRATLEITGNSTLTKTYDGQIGFGGNADLTKYYTIRVNDTEVTGVEGLTLELNKEISGRGINVGSHIVSLLMNGTAVSINDFKEPEVEGLKNYTITYERDKDENKFHVTAKTVKYYFTSEGSKYNGNVKTLSESDYEVKVDETDGFVDGEEDSWGEGNKPTAKFAEKYTEVKNAGDYDLVTATGGEDKGNYTFELLEEKGKNVYTVEESELTVNINDQELDFGELTAENYEEILAEWMKYSSTSNVVTFKGVGTGDGQPLRRIVKLTLTPDEEGANIGDSGDYTIGIKVAEDDELSEADQITKKNYKFNTEASKGTLTIGNESGEFTLDVAEDLDEKTAETDKILAKITAKNGAKYDKVTVKNLKAILGAEIKGGQWYTLVLPFEVTVRELSKAFGYAIVNVPNENNEDQSVIKFSLTMGTVPANTLMAFKVDRDLDWEDIIGDNEEEGEIVFTNKKIVAPTGTWATDKAGNEFIGVYETTTTESGVDYWMWTDGAFWNGAMDINPLSGYIHSGSGNQNARVYFEEADGSTTAVDVVKMNSVNKTDAEGWYTVGGVKLNAQPTQKGIYINNGKKVVIK